MQAKKSLGQNLLKSKSAINKIILSSDLNKDDVVLEIGPGEGILTEQILKIVKKVFVVEKDDRLIPFLKEKFDKEIKEEKLEIIHGDILEENLNFLPKKYKLVANIPYYITGQIIRKFLENPPAETQPSLITLLVQKEVAERIVARPARRGGGDKKESLLSISVKVYGDPKIEGAVPRGSFSPIPKVDSAIISIKNISKNNFSEIKEKDFFEVLHAGFAHKRKQLIPNLSNLFEREGLLETFKDLKINTKARAEEISTENWLKIVEQKNTQD